MKNKPIYKKVILIIMVIISTIYFAGCENVDKVVNDRDGNTQLMESITKSNKDHAKYYDYEKENQLVFELIGKGANINYRNNWGETPLILAVEAGDIDIIKALIDKGADIDAQRDTKLTLSKKPNDAYSGNTALFSAVVLAKKDKGIDILKVLLENGANTNIKNGNEETVLHWASTFEQLESVKLLIDYGADIDIVDNEGNTPLLLASLSSFLHNNMQIIDYLISEGADIKKTNNEGRNYDYYKKENEEYLKRKRESNTTTFQVKTKEEPRIGMTAKEVEKSLWGSPKKVNKTTTIYGVSEQWVYSIDRYVYLENGIVTAIQE